MSLIGPTARQAVEWSPIVEGKTDVVWTAHTHELSEGIAVAAGKPLPLLKDPRDDGALGRAALEFVAANGEQLELAGCGAGVAEIIAVGRLFAVTLRLSFNETPIAGASVVLTLNQAGELVTVKAVGFGGEVQGEFSLDESTAAALAAKSLPVPSTSSNSVRVYLPRRAGDKRIILVPAYRVELTTGNPAYQPTVYLHGSTGQVLAAENRVRFIELVGAASGGYFPLYGRRQPELAGFVDEWVQLDRDSTFTDQDGLFSFEVSEGDSPYDLNSLLRGRWVQVEEFEVRSATFSAEVEAGHEAAIVWTDDNSSPDERNLFVQVNRVHSLFKQIEPDFRGLDFPILAVCGVGGEGYEQFEDNAFSSAEGLFFGRGRQFDNFAHYADVIWHEYGHSVTAHIYRNADLPYEGESGALNEAWSDYFTCSFTGEAIIGEGGLLGNGYIRNIDNRLRYPEDIRGEVHDDSRIVSAAMWHTREQLGAEYADSLFHFARYLHADDFRGYFLDVLTTDDDDGDMTNGSPNYRVIYEQFARHGIDLGDLPHFSITRKTLSDAGGGGGAGNDNGLWEPDETIELEVEVFRAGVEAGNDNDPVFVALETDSPHLELIRSRVEIEPLAVGEHAVTPDRLLVHILPDAPLRFANLYLTVGTAQGETPALDTLRIVLGRPDILLVRDGREGTDRSPWFHSALDSLEMVYSDLRAAAPVRPLRQTLPSYRFVVWFTGDDRSGILDSISLAALNDYLDAGGRLLVAGQYACSAEGATEFMERRLGARLVNDSLMPVYLEGVANDPVGRGYRLLLLGGDGARNQLNPQIIEPVAGAIVTHLWTRVEGSPPGAVRREERNTGARTVFMAFGLEAVGGRNTNSRAEVLQAVLEWLDEETGLAVESAAPVAFRLGAPYPTPFNGVLNLPITLGRAGAVSLEIFDPIGRSVLSQTRALPAGRTIWNVADLNWVSGVYLIRARQGEVVLESRAVMLK